MAEVERHQYDVVVIGAGGAGLRAVIEARGTGLEGRSGPVSRCSGKAHTVMAEGGCAAAMGNANPKDNWQVHFRDTMRGGKSSTTGGCRAARQGGARSCVGAGNLRRAIRPHQGWAY